MPASTQSTVNALVDLSQKMAAGFRNAADEGVSPQGSAVIQVLEDSFTVPTTALDDVGDVLRLWRFPAGCFLHYLRAVFSDQDTNATPTLVGDLLITDSSDTTLHTLVSGSTKAQTGSAVADEMLAAKRGVFVGGSYLSWKTTTAAATAAAGTIKCMAMVSIGVVTFGSATGGGGQDPRLTDPSI